MAGFFKRLKSTSQATIAINRPLQEILGDVNEMHPELRRYAISFLNETEDLSSARFEPTGRMLANILVSLQIGRDCNTFPQGHWETAGPLFINFGNVMKELGLQPRLVWPTYDADNAPEWADVE